MEEYIIQNEEIFLKGELKGNLLKEAESKFDKKGRVLNFPGCSIICKIPIKSGLFNEIKLLQSKYKYLNPQKAYVYLPESSFHMTLFDCCNVNTFNTKYWPKKIEKDENYKNVANQIYQKIKNLDFPKEFNLKLKKLFGGYSIILEGNTKKDEKILRDYRNILSDLLGIRFANHETYSFHITFAYILRKLTDDEVKKLIKINFRLLGEFFEKNPSISVVHPELCIFNDMLEFKSFV